MEKIELDFPRIEGHYGVNQAWMGKTPYIRNRSCGLAALLNVLIYEKVLPIQSRKKAAYYLDQMVKPWLPRPWGIPNFLVLQGLFKTFTKKPYQLVSYRGPFGDTKRVAIFIEEGLKKGHPLLLLTYGHKNPHFHNHWVTLTGLFEKEGKTYFIASNWGERRIYKLEDYLSLPSPYRSLGYFEPKNK